MERVLHRHEDLTPEDAALAELLCSGADERCVVVADGLSKYGCAPYPRPVIAFASCTASTVHPRGWAAARAASERIQEGSARIGLLPAADQMGTQIQQTLLSLMELADVPGLRVVLTPSGSDAETIAVFFAALPDERPIVNIVVGAREVGSGSVLAAGARYFSERVPSGRTRAAGEAVDAQLADRITVHEIKVRSDSAAERSPDEIDAEIEELVERSLRAGARVVIHIVAHSKTGVHAPRLDTMNRLIAKHGDRIVPIIDAAQGRFSRRGLRDYVSRGFMVILTGSKFYGGPPFSGCLLLPARFLPSDPDRIRFPAGFSDYLTPAQLPAEWTAARRSLEQTANSGLLIRWMAAMEEMQAYYETPSWARYRVLRSFEAQAPIILGRSRLLQLINVPVPILSDEVERLLESKTTVFSFRVSARTGAQLDQATLKRWVRWMNRDISSLAPADTPAPVRDAVSTCFQLGQAVHVGEQQSGEHDHVIRVAIGGTLITDVAVDTALGATLDARLGWLERKLEQLRTKIEFIAEHEPAMSRL
jgi:hypothetical protein